MVFRPVTLDVEVDRALPVQARREGATQGELLRRWLSDGMQRAAAGEPRPELDPNIPLPLRAVYLRYSVDERLGDRAYALNMPTQHLIRQYLWMGGTLSALKFTNPGRTGCRHRCGQRGPLQATRARARRQGAGRSAFDLREEAIRLVVAVSGVIQEMVLVGNDFPATHVVVRDDMYGDRQVVVLVDRIVLRTSANSRGMSACCHKQRRRASPIATVSKFHR